MRHLSFLPVVVLSALTGTIGAFAQLANGQNAITYPLGGYLDTKAPLTITWTPTTKGTITINLLKGPPSNFVDLGPIAASINNDGTFTWTVPTSLQDSGAMPKGDKYGFKIIDDETKTFAYSPPFDLSILDSTYGGAVPSVTASPTTTAAAVVASTSPEPSSSSSSSSSFPVTPTTPTQESASSTSDSVASTTPAPTSTDLPSSSSVLETSLSSTLPTTTPTPNPSQSNMGEVPAPNTGPNIPLIIGASAGAFGGLAFLIVAIVMLVKCRKRRSRARALKPLGPARPPAQSMRGYGDGMYNRV